jgi:hypothetical protein
MSLDIAAHLVVGEGNGFTIVRISFFSILAAGVHDWAD